MTADLEVHLHAVSPPWAEVLGIFLVDRIQVSGGGAYKNNGKGAMQISFIFSFVSFSFACILVIASSRRGKDPL